MRFRPPATAGAVTALLALVTGLTACDDGGASSPDAITAGDVASTGLPASGAATPSGNGSITRESLIRAVLTKAELPPGYDGVRTPLRENTDPPEDPDISDPACRPLTTDALPAPRPGVIVERNFSGSGDTDTAPARLEGYTSADLDRRMSDMHRALEVCRSWTNLNGGDTPSTTTVTRLTAPRLGDDAVAYRLDTAGGLLPGSIAVVTVRVGDILLTVGTLEIGDKPSRLPGEEIVRAQVDKLRRTFAS